jgi:secreted trypsin-like serine protease
VPEIGQELTAFGFGRTESRPVSAVLRQGQFSYIPNDVCTDRLDGYISAPQIFDDILCVDTVETSSICDGDSGGPLT